MKGHRTHLISGGTLAALLLHGLPAAAQSTSCADLEQRFEAAHAEAVPLQLSLMLFAASDSGCNALANLLIEAGASVVARDRSGSAPLTRAARAGHVETVKLLLDRGADINQRNLDGSTALFAAIENRKTDVSSLLVSRGADATLPGRSGITPLAAAAYNGDGALVALMIAGNADIRSADATGKTPIVYAAARGAATVVGLLLDAGVDPNARYTNSLTALAWAAGYADGVAEADGVRSVTLLLDRGARIDDADDRGRTPLMIAVERGHEAVALLLAKRGADPVRRDNEGHTAAELGSHTMPK